MTKVLVTGGSGFIGTNLIDSLLRRGCQVLNLDCNPPRNKAHNNIWSPCDINDFDKLNVLVENFQPNFVYHLAARTDLQGGSVDDYPQNVKGTNNLILALDNLSCVDRVFFASSRLVCEIGYQPVSDSDYKATTPYGESKILTEKIVRDLCAKANYKWLIFRPTSIWGPWFGTPYRDFFESVLNGRYLHPRGDRIYKSFGFVGNSVEVLIRLMLCDGDLVDGKTFYLADSRAIEVLSWGNIIRVQAGRNPIPEVPQFILQWAAKCGDFLQLLGVDNPKLTSFRLKNLLTPMVHDTHFVELIYPEPDFSVEDGVQLTLDWLQDHR